MKSDFRFRMSFRSWLVLLTVLAVGFGGAVMLISSSVDTQQKRDDEARMVLGRAAAALAERLDDELRDIARDLTLAAQNDMLLQPDTHAAAVQHYLQNWHKLRPEYADILLADRSGRIRATASASDLATDVSASLWFGKALDGIAVGESAHSVKAGVEFPPKVIVGAPLSRDGERASGVLAVQLDQSWIDDLIAGVRRTFGNAGARISFEVMDAGGRLIHKPDIPGHGPFNAQIIEATAPEDARQALRLGWLIIARGAAAEIIVAQGAPSLIALMIAAMMAAGAVAWIVGGRLGRHIRIARGVALGHAPGESLKPLRVEELHTLVETIAATNARAQSKERLLQDTRAALLRSRERVRAFESMAGWNCWDIDLAKRQVTWNGTWNETWNEIPTDVAAPMLSAASENIMPLDEFFDRLEPGDRDKLRAAFAAGGKTRDASMRMPPSEDAPLGRRLLLRMKSADERAPASRVFVLSREMGVERLDTPVGTPIALGPATSAPGRRGDDAARPMSPAMMDDINNALTVIMTALGSLKCKNGLADGDLWPIEAAFQGAKQAAARACSEKPNALPIDRGGGRPSRLFNILFVEADDLVRSTVARVLADLGHTVMQATSGRDAMRILAERRDFHMMIADHANPGFDGVQLAEVVSRTHPLMRIILTGSRGHFPQSAKNFQQLNKPFGVQELSLAIQAAPPVQASGGSQALAGIKHQAPRGEAS